jgi:hypothetical protein
MGKYWYNKATLRTLGITEGKKNNTYYPTILNININKNKNTLKNININKFKVNGVNGVNRVKRVNRVNRVNGARLYYLNQLNIKDSLNFPNRLVLIKNQRKYYHISNIRAINRIGPQTEDVLSVIIGFLLGDGCCAQPLYIIISFTTLINLPLNTN